MNLASFLVFFSDGMGGGIKWVFLLVKTRGICKIFVVFFIILNFCHKSIRNIYLYKKEIYILLGNSSTKIKLRKFLKILTFFTTFIISRKVVTIPFYNNLILQSLKSFYLVIFFSDGVDFLVCKIS